MRGDPFAIFRRWWTAKYHKSSKSSEFQAYTLFELAVEFFEDWFEKHPDEAVRQNGGFVETGDPVIDKWERELKAGLEPDLTEGMTEDAKEDMLRWARRHNAQVIGGARD